MHSHTLSIKTSWVQGTWISFSFLSLSISSFLNKDFLFQMHARSGLAVGNYFEVLAHFLVILSKFCLAPSGKTERKVRTHNALGFILTPIFTNS